MNQTFLRLLFFFFLVNSASANNMLVQNVTTTGNDAVNKTIQVQFDISWDNSWRDAINWDAAWIFMKFKDANGLWQHAQLNQTGFTNGTGTANTLQVTSDKVGSWLYRSALGAGTFNSTGMQLQWNYGLSGITDVTGLEVRVFAVEMVYVPEGDFNCAYWCSGIGTSDIERNVIGFKALGPAIDSQENNFPVINNRLSPVLYYSNTFFDPNSYIAIRLKGDAGIDTDNNGTVDNTTYPIGYSAFYCYKYEMTEQQYADFLNTLTSAQITTLGVAGTGITFTNGQYFSSTPNRACVNANGTRLLAFADWAGIRPISFTEFNKASYGPLQPVNYTGSFNSGSSYGPYPAWGSNANPSVDLINSVGDVGRSASISSNRTQSGASYFGIMDMTGNTREPVVKLNYFSFTSQNGNGVLNFSGNNDVAFWNTTSMLTFIEQWGGGSVAAWNIDRFGFRYVRSAE
jgi:hypothetical protein